MPLGTDFCDAWIFKLNSDGDTLWTRTYGGAYDDAINCVILTPDGIYCRGIYRFRRLERAMPGYSSSMKWGCPMDECLWRYGL